MRSDPRPFTAAAAAAAASTAMALVGIMVEGL